MCPEDTAGMAEEHDTKVGTRAPSPHAVLTHVLGLVPSKLLESLRTVF